MEEKRVRIRIASTDDVRELLEIYRPYVEKTVITFEYDVPTPEEFETRMKRTLARYPYLVAEQDGALLGYAYTGPFVGRAAYAWGVETTIYLREEVRRMGVGRKLYTVLEEISRAQNIRNMNACIGYPAVEDEHLTMASVRFHEHMEYRMVGEFHQCGYKFGRWYHMVWMEKLIAGHPSDPAPVLPFPELCAEQVRKICDSV
ncbi:MAG: N-acetyltransferase family protein [Clostridiales bacterium]|nr:N-acetyltransferase family protein [Clostridiales bacterium]